LWLLDRLLPDSDFGFFEQHLDSERGIYAWARRLPPEKRVELIRFPVTSSPGDWHRQMIFQSLVLGWCDSCPDDQLSSLLEWPEYWKAALEWHDVCYLPPPEKEFYRRCPNIEHRRKPMLASLRRNIPLLNSSERLTSEMARHAVASTWKFLLKDIATQNPCAEGRPLTDDAWDAWLSEKLSSLPFAELTELGRDLLKTGSSWRYYAQSVWIWLHGSGDWDLLYRTINYLADNYCYFERLAEIVPPGRLDIWDGLVMSDSRFERIHAFCQWLPAQYSEVLRDHFNHPDRDWAAYAYQNYLAKTPEPILQHYFKLFDDLPGWQLELLDRRLYALEPVRPAALLDDMQTVEGDVRLQDPFNHRGY
jgi:hypothetical protein